MDQLALKEGKFLTHWPFICQFHLHGFISGMVGKILRNSWPHGSYKEMEEKVEKLSKMFCSYQVHNSFWHCCSFTLKFFTFFMIDFDPIQDGPFWGCSWIGVKKLPSFYPKSVKHCTMTKLGTVIMVWISPLLKEWVMDPLKLCVIGGTFLLCL